MKKIVIFSILAFGMSLFASQTLYPNVVKSLYKNKGDKSAVGRLLPTTELKVLAKKGDWLKVQIDGFVQKGKEQALYFSQGTRILVAAFRKSSIPKYKVTKKGKWDKVSVVLWTKDVDMEKQLKPMMKRAAKLYTDNCSMCHKLHEPDEYNPNQWPSMFKAMADRTGIPKKDRFLVIEYLQKTTTKR